MNKPEKILYKTRVTAKGGRVGQAEAEDGNLKVDLVSPKELGGDGGQGTNPEQLFGAAYSACFLGAAKHVAGKENVELPDDVEVTAEVGFGPIDGGFSLDVELLIDMPGVDVDVARDLIAKAHKVCPFSNATRNSIEVRLTLVD